MTAVDVHREDHADRHEPGGPDALSLTSLSTALAGNGLDASGSTLVVDPEEFTPALAGFGLIDNGDQLDVDLGMVNILPTTSQRIPAGYVTILPEPGMYLPSGVELRIDSGGGAECETLPERAGLGWSSTTGRMETLRDRSFAELPYGVGYEIPVGDALTIDAGSGLVLGQPPMPLGPNPARDQVAYGAPSGTPVTGDRYYDRTNDRGYVGSSTPAWIRSSTWGSAAGRTGATYTITAQSVANTTVTALSFTTRVADTDSFQTGAGPWTTFTLPSGTDGLYAMTLEVDTGNATPARAYAEIVTGGVTYRVSMYGEYAACVAPLVPLAAANAIAANIFHSSGGSLNVNARLTFYRIGP